MPQQEQEQETQPRTRRRVKTSKKWPFVLLVVLLIAAAFYVIQAFQMSPRFLKGTSINNVDVSELTAEEAEAKVLALWDNYGIDLTFRDGKAEHITQEQIGLEFTHKGDVETLLKEQNHFLWPAALLGRQEVLSYPVEFTFSEEKLKDLFFSYDELNKSLMTIPENAHLLVSDGKCELIPEVYGDCMKGDLAYEFLYRTILDQGTSVDFTQEEGVYANPTVFSDDESLAETEKELSKFLSTSVTYQMKDGSQRVLDGNTFQDWLSIHKGNPYDYYIDWEKVTENVNRFIDEMADGDDIQTTDVLFHSTNHGDVYVDGKEHGHIIDREAEKAALLRCIEYHRRTVREPAYTYDVPSQEQGDTYAEVDIQEQHVYFYKDGELLVDTKCVTGTAGTGRETPTGFYKVFAKQRSVTLYGRPKEDGTPSYASYVEYWMPFNGGIGLHDAGWRDSFGGSIYTYAGSHGCVNMPRSKAKEIYANIEVGTPVIVIDE